PIKILSPGCIFRHPFTKICWADLKNKGATH
ncbi:unnamed protein product, partial [marine sediment metagenome]